MATATRPSAIAGVSAGAERAIETLYPSIAASGFGRLLGRICDLIPARVNGIKLSHLLLAPLVAPLGAAGYFKFKLLDNIYVLTNRSIQVRRALGARLVQQIALADIDNVGIDVLPGQEFFKAGDLAVLNAKGDVILQLPGVPHPERFRQVIFDAREARLRNDESLRTIESRHSA